MHRARLLVAAALLVVGTSNANAQQTLTFEEFAHLEQITTQYFGINFQGATVLTQGESGVENEYPPHSGLNTVYNPTGVMELLFSSPISYFQAYFTYTFGLTVQGYDLSNTLVASVNSAFFANYIGSGSGAPNELLRIDSPDIWRVVVSDDFGAGNSFTMDDAQFTGSQDLSTVPEPATMTLLATGLAGMAAARRRKKA